MKAVRRPNSSTPWPPDVPVRGHRDTTEAQISLKWGRNADRAHIAVGASVVAAQRITSSAWKSSVGGIVRPRALAVFRLITNSNFIGCSTGRLAGLAPFRILST